MFTKKNKNEKQQVIIPAGLIQSEDFTVIEIPKRHLHQPMVVARPQELDVARRRCEEVFVVKNGDQTRRSGRVNFKNAPASAAETKPPAYGRTVPEGGFAGAPPAAPPTSSGTIPQQVSGRVNFKNAPASAAETRPPTYGWTVPEGGPAGAPPAAPPTSSGTIPQQARPSDYGGTFLAGTPPPGGTSFSGASYYSGMTSGGVGRSPTEASVGGVYPGSTLSNPPAYPPAPYGGVLATSSSAQRYLGSTLSNSSLYPSVPYGGIPTSSSGQVYYSGFPPSQIPAQMVSGGYPPAPGVAAPLIGVPLAVQPTGVPSLTGMPIPYQSSLYATTPTNQVPSMQLPKSNKLNERITSKSPKKKSSVSSSQGSISQTKYDLDKAERVEKVKLQSNLEKFQLSRRQFLKKAYSLAEKIAIASADDDSDDDDDSD